MSVDAEGLAVEQLTPIVIGAGEDPRAIHRHVVVGRVGGGELGHQF